MTTNLALDDALITEAQKLGHHTTKRAAVTQALKESFNIANRQRS